MRKIPPLLFALASIFISGCTTIDVTVQPVAAWEGHYMSIDEFKKATESITLEKGQTIWVLSNNTLKRVILNAIDKGKQL